MYSGDQDISKIQKVLAKRRAKSLREQEEYNFEELMDIVRNQRQDAQKVINKMTRGKSGDTGLEEDINSLQNYFDAYENLFNKYQQARKQPGAEKPAEKAELVVKTKKGEVVPVKPDDQKKIVQIFELIQDWITIYKFIITQFAEDVKTLGGDPQKQLPPPAVKLLTTKVQLLLPPPEKLLPVPVEPDPVPLDPDEPEEEEEAEEKPEPTEPADEQPPEPINKEDVENYIEALQEFLDNFMKVRTLKEQSDIFYKFQQSVFKLTGKPTDEIVGDQIAALTRTAQNLTEQEEPKTAQNSAVKGESKDILTGAQVTQRHVKAVQQIMMDYQEYLGEFGSKKGVTVGSRKMFDKFGVSNPKELLYKFVKLLANDINQMVEKMNSMKQKIKAASEKTEKPPEEKEQEQELNEEKKKMSLKEKIDLVEEVYIYVRKNGVDLRDAISQFVEEAEADKGKEKAGEDEAEADEEKEESGQESQPSAEPQVQKEQEEAGVGGVATTGQQGREKLGAGAEEGERVGARTGRPDKEVYGNYKQIALDIDDQLERIANFFPTARPFDSKYTMKQAQKSFLTVIKKLDTVVANVKNFLRDEDINVPTLNDLTQELLAIKEVMKSIFGLTDEQQQAENQGAISDAGEESGLPQAPDKETQPDGDSPSKNVEELKEKLNQISEGYSKTNYLMKLIMSISSKENDPIENAAWFKPIQGSQRGRVIASITGIENKFKRQNDMLAIAEDKIEKNIQQAAAGDFSSTYETLKNAIVQFFRRLVVTGAYFAQISEQKDTNRSINMIRRVGQKMLDSIAAFYLMDRVSKNLQDGKTEELNEEDIKFLDTLVKTFKEDVSQIQTIVKRYNIPKTEKEFDRRSLEFYKGFHQFKIPSMSRKPSKKKDNEDSPVEPEQEEEIVDNLENEEDQNTDQEGYAFVEDEELEDIIDAEIIEVVPDLEDKPEERKRLTQKIIPLLTDKTNEQETEQKQIAQKEIEDIKKENPETDAEEVIEQAAQKLLTDSGGDISEDLKMLKM